ncbi:hypothetical protein MRB53_033022 [Persea americana]|uniref:Uncharacterized protein n=1 Tax=Persea americana TaxID=3435 RepID=A0ACC2KTH9_PERAE|nr:hypothetical protein MRB53_033022 [Persea americana]
MDLNCGDDDDVSCVVDFIYSDELYGAREFPTLAKLIIVDFRTIVSSNAGPHWHNLRRGLPNGTINLLYISVHAPLQESSMA